MKRLASFVFVSLMLAIAGNAANTTAAQTGIVVSNGHNDGPAPMPVPPTD